MWRMRNIDFSPLYRSTIGFDRVLDLLGAMSAPEPDGWPPYDIERVAEDRYRITLAVAGYENEELSITAERNVLIVEGRKREDQPPRKYLHRGIVQVSFRRQFDLADFVKVASASYEDGLLVIELEREVPEAMKPRRIQIAGRRDQLWSAPHEPEQLTNAS
jgi:molecular chaperone IbpA